MAKYAKPRTKQSVIQRQKQNSLPQKPKVPKKPVVAAKPITPVNPVEKKKPLAPEEAKRKR